MQDAVIVSAVRTPVGKAPKGALRFTRPDELAALVVREALARAAGVPAADIDDVILGCAMPEAEQGLNVARIASLRAGLPVTASAVTVNRFCASGLQAIANAADRIRVGEARAIIAGGTESMSLVPMGGHKVAPNPHRRASPAPARAQASARASRDRAPSTPAPRRRADAPPPRRASTAGAARASPAHRSSPPARTHRRSPRRPSPPPPDPRSPHPPASETPAHPPARR